jgi:hypothetical protein
LNEQKQPLLGRDEGYNEWLENIHIKERMDCKFGPETGHPEECGVFVLFLPYR